MMEALNDALTDRENLIHIAAAIFLTGFLFRDQVILRSLVIVGNCVYVVYYYVVVVHPLWGGIGLGAALNRDMAEKVARA